jgi:hypothetical protein
MAVPRRWKHRLAALLMIPLGLTLSGGCASSSTGSPALAVDRVVLYQSGVAYIERTGQVDDDHFVLRVRPDQINDVLSSLIVIDLDHGAPATVSLPARGPGDDGNVLPSGDSTGMTALLSSLRGADVRIRHKDTRTRGRLVGIEGDRLTVLVDGRRTRFISLSDIDEVEFENEAVAMRIRHSLDESLSADDWQSVEVTVRFPPGERRRNLLIAWVVEMPLWKPAYRVLIDSQGQMHLQGWAVVDNLSGEDWEDIELSLTSGTPLSFRFDLHSPIRIDRPEMSGYGTPRAVDLRPPTPMRATASPPPSRAAPEPSSRAAPQRSGTPLSANRPRADDLDFDMSEPEPATEEEQPERLDRITGAASSIGESAQIRELDSLFRFEIPGRVTLPDRSSTLVTLVNSSVEGQDLLIYQPGAGASSDHPFRSLLLENTTGAPIQRSPVAIYREDTFVGEGITPQIAPGEKAVLPYALESRVHVDRRHSTRSGEVQLIRILNGRLEIERESFQSWVFEVSSSLDEAQTLFVQVPRHQGHELIVDEALDVRREDHFYLIPIEIPAGGEHTEEIVQLQRAPGQLEVFHALAPPLILAALNRPDLRPDVAEKLRTLSSSLTALADVEQTLTDDRQLRTDIQSRTAELRENIALLGDGDRSAGLRDQLLERLAEQDELLVVVSSRIVERSETRSALRVEIQEQMRELTLERQ